MVKSDFLKYSVKDFLLDESFQEWVHQSHNLPTRGWEDWLNDHPERKLVVEEARITIAQLKSQLEEGDADLDEAWATIEARMNT